jgi:two-component system chemotaxis response regulator CheB
MARAIRVLVTDDSAFMRRAIARMLEGEGDFEIVGTAASGEEAVEKARTLSPDVITMDVEMPGIGGLEAIRAICANRPAPPIIMVSSLTREGAETTLRGLELGATDFIPKPDSAYIDIVKLRRELIEKVRTLGSGAIGVRARATRRALGEGARPPTGYACVAIGASTGGPIALMRLLGALPARFPLPIVIVQHMPPGFTKPLAERLAAAGALEVLEGIDGLALRPGCAVLAPAGWHLRVRKRAAVTTVMLETDNGESLHVPSVDVMTASVGKVYGAGTIGVILTGMGQDGVVGLRVIKESGGYVIAQDEESSVVYGMPRAAVVAGLADRIAPLEEIPRILCQLAETPYTP